MLVLKVYFLLRNLAMLLELKMCSFAARKSQLVEKMCPQLSSSIVILTGLLRIEMIYPVISRSVFLKYVLFLFYFLFYFMKLRLVRDHNFIKNLSRRR